MSILIVILMYAGWSSMFSLGKMALEHSSPLFLTAARMLLAGALLCGFLLIKNPKAYKLSLKKLGLIGLLALFSVYLTNALEFWSLKHMTAAKTCFIYSLSPFFSALFSYLHFKEKMTPRKWVGMSIGFLGILPVLSVQKGADELLSGLAYLSWPELAMVGASVCTVYGWILLRLIVRDNTVSPFTANGISMLLGGLVALAHSGLVDSWHPIPITQGTFLPFVQGLFIMTLISNIICYNVYGMMLKRFTATFVAFMGILSPIFASLSSWFFLNEPLSPIIFLSTGIVSLGLWLIYSEELRQGYIVAPAQKAQAQNSPN